MRATYNTIQNGMQTHLILSQDRIDRLEDIGFQREALSGAAALKAAIICSIYRGSNADFKRQI